MHAYIFIGKESGALKSRVLDLQKKLGARLMEYQIVKIDDVRSLGNIIRLGFGQKVLIYSPDIHQAGEEALNAFLKNLEEPQENVFFALSAPSVKKVMPTVVSRCQVIKVSGKSVLRGGGDDVDLFLKMSCGEKLAYVERMKGRDTAKKFAEDLLDHIHAQIAQGKSDYKILAKNAKITEKTILNLKANGNSALQLANLAINLI